MEKKANKEKGRLVGYLRDLSIVVVGIAVTFAGNDLISKLSEKSKLKQELQLVQQEIEDNLKKVDEVKAYYDKVSSLQAYISTLEEAANKISSLPADTLEKYSEVIAIKTFSYKQSAFETLKYSGSMRTMSKLQLQELMNCYQLLEVVKSQHDKVMDSKRELAFNLMFQLLLNPPKHEVKMSEFQYSSTLAVTGMDVLFGSCQNELKQYLATYSTKSGASFPRKGAEIP